MSENKKPGDQPSGVTDPEQFLRNMTKAAESTTQFLAGIIASNQNGAEEKQPANPFESIGRAGQALFGVAEPYLTDPKKLVDAQFDLWQRHMDIWHSSFRRFMGESVDPVIAPERGDRRFNDKEWEDNPFFDLLKQSYLVTAKWAEDMVENAEGIDRDTRHRGDFYVKQLANALSPSNFVFTNPEVLRATLASNGENLVKGLDQLFEDYDSETGTFRIKQTDMDAFEVGGNLATTPGKVVFQNDLLQLIQYNPTTEEVMKRPLLIVPPWINKFYILDLVEKKSFIKWAVEQGITVFVVSWVNPDERLAQKTFDDYMREGVLAAVGAATEATGEPSVNAIGYCIGGTMLAATLAHMAGAGDERIASATFFTSQVDFEDAGDLRVFIDEEQIQALEEKMAEKGYLEGRSMANTFNMLRSNDLIWSYVVNNYLLGKEPFPFDLLYWNADSTRMPAAMHSTYLRECYLENNLVSGEMKLGDSTIDLSKVKIPTYNLATREDHIAPLPSAFKIGKFLGGDTELVVAGSGHIAGVVNPPAANKYQYWTNAKNPDTLEEWLDTAEEHPGSWWPHWRDWLSQFSDGTVPARTPGEGKLKAIEDAPGSYVRVRAGAKGPAAPEQDARQPASSEPASVKQAKPANAAGKKSGAKSKAKSSAGNGKSSGKSKSG